MPGAVHLAVDLLLEVLVGLDGKIRPPPRHSGLFAWPARARPVPFCFHGFLCDLLISPRDFCARVPCRPFAW